MNPEYENPEELAGMLIHELGHCLEEELDEISKKEELKILPTMAPIPITVINLVDASYENVSSCTA